MVSLLLCSVASVMRRVVAQDVTSFTLVACYVEEQDGEL